MSLSPADVGGDGDVDVAVAADTGNLLAWYENDGGHYVFTQRLVKYVNNAYAVSAVDVDGDGDVDVLAASYGDHTVAWYENDGSQSFTETIITATAEAAQAVYAIEVDGDGDVDALSASSNDDTVAWYERLLDARAQRRRPRASADGHAGADDLLLRALTSANWLTQTSLAGPTSARSASGRGARDGGYLFEYGGTGHDGASFGLKTAPGSEEGNVTLALQGVYETTVDIEGDGAAIDWADWHHYCVSFGGTTVTLSFDGLAEAAVDVFLDTEEAYHLRLGADIFLNNHFTGALDELYVYASVLDAAEVAVLYQALVAPSAAPSPAPTRAPTAPPPLVAYYSFDGDSAKDDFDGDGAGTMDGSITGATATAGPYGGDALYFDGGNRYVSFPPDVTAHILGASARWRRRLRDYQVELAGMDDGSWHHYCLAYDGAAWSICATGSSPRP
ncbi:hypothetical protein JL720_16486 [Aureococcus anophagefferens]|nr:hypothetical protein JL720_16486 [Aureococcus anophagefferens]